MQLTPLWSIHLRHLAIPSSLLPVTAQLAPSSGKATELRAGQLCSRTSTQVQAIQRLPRWPPSTGRSYLEQVIRPTAPSSVQPTEARQGRNYWQTSTQVQLVPRRRNSHFSGTPFTS